MPKTKNPVTVGVTGFRNIKALGGVDFQDPTELPRETQSELLAVASVMRCCRVSFWHAKTICQLHGLGGHA